MPSMNKVILMGHLGKDPDVKMTQAGKQVATVSLATSETWTANGQKQQKTEWHNLVLWDKGAELVGKYCHKGDCVMVEGKITQRSWDGQDGQKHYKTEIIVDKITFVSKKGEGGGRDHDAPPPEPYGHAGATPPPPTNSGSSYGSDFSEDDVPF